MAVEHSSGSTGDRSAPIRYRIRPGTEFTVTIDPETGAEKSFAKDRRTGDVFHLGAEEYFICLWLNGATSFSKIQSAFAARFKSNLTPGQFEALLIELEKAGLLVETGAPADDAAPVSAMSAPEFQAPGGVYLRLFDPTLLLSVVHGAAGWLRGFALLLIPAGVFACFILFNAQAELSADLGSMGFSIATAVKLFAAIIGCSLFAKLAQGVTAYHFGAEVREFGLRFAFGVIPQFQVDRSGVAVLPKRARLWVHGAPLIARLALFIAGAFLWLVFRQSSDAIADASLLISQVGFWSFIFTAIPVLPTDGYLLFSTLIDRPALLDRAVRLMELRLRGKRLPEALSPSERRMLTLFGVAAVLIVAIGLAAAVAIGGAFLERRLSGTGVILLLAAVGVAVVWLRHIWGLLQGMRSRNEASISGMSNKVVAIPGQAERRQPALRGGQELALEGNQSAFARRAGALPGPWIAGALLGGLIGLLAIIPYSFEAGGDFIILPTIRVEVRARTDGPIEKIHVGDGDVVEEGQILAELAVWEEKRDLEVAMSSLNKAEAELRVLEAGASAEAIEASKARVQAAKVRADVSTSEYLRMRPLWEQGVISDKQAAVYEGEYLKNKADLDAARANLKQTEAAASPDLLDSARADVARLNTQIAYLQQQVDAAVIVAPISGRVVSDNIDLQVGSHLTVGGLFAVIEDTGVAQAQILVPQTSIAEVEIGDEVRLKPWGYSGTVLKGKVVSIAPSAETTDRGQFVRVKTEIDNSLGILMPQMTGYAKIDGSTMSVLEAFTRIYVRFFRVEVWSWIP